MKKFFSVLTLALTLILVTSTLPKTALATNQTNYKIGDVVQVGKYTGILISQKDLPKNIIPKTVKDMSEAELFVDSINDSFDKLSQQTTSVQIPTVKQNLRTLIPMLGSDPVIQSRQDVVNGGPIPGCSFHVVANYSYCYNYYGSYFNSINSVSSYLSGLTATIGWSQTDYSASIINDTTIKTIVYGRITDYLITPIGLIAIGGHNEAVTTYFYL